MGVASGKCRLRYLDDIELKRVHVYVLSNCKIIREYEVNFENFILTQHPQLSFDDIRIKFELQFPNWFKEQISSKHCTEDILQALATGPSRQVKSWDDTLLMVITSEP